MDYQRGTAGTNTPTSVKALPQKSAGPTFWEICGSLSWQRVSKNDSVKRLIIRGGTRGQLTPLLGDGVVAGVGGLSLLSGERQFSGRARPHWMLLNICLRYAA
jgi:hypothetical protein